MFCYECGKEILEGSKFCSYCGTNLLSDDGNAVSVDTTDNSFESAEETFCMIIQDVFSITGRGTVVTGTVESGALCVGQNVKICDYDDNVYSVEGIEKDRVVIDSAKKGDAVGILLSKLERTDKIKGKKLLLQNNESNLDNTPDYEKIFGFAEQVSSSGVTRTNPKSQPINNTHLVNTVNNQSDDMINSQINPPEKVMQRSTNSQGIPEIKANVTLRTGNGLTIFSAMNLGSLIVSAHGVSFRMNIGNSANNHSYSFDQIASTNFSMTHAGLNPSLSYKVLLKDGTQYIYIYAMLEKSKLNSIDNIIKNNITK